METASLAQTAPPRLAPTTPATGTSPVNVGATERVLSVAAGALLAYLGLKRESTAAKVGLTALGADLVVRGTTGYCWANQLAGRNSAQKSDQPAPVEIVQTFTIFRPAAEVYGFWRQLENLPRFMQHLESVRQLDERRSHWEARVPGGLGTIGWEAEITADEPGRRLAYRSLPGSQVDQAGEVLFREAPGNRGTEVQTVMHYRAPAGALGQGIAKLLNPVTKQLVREDLRRFKQLMESGEIPTNVNHAGGKSAGQK